MSPKFSPHAEYELGARDIDRKVVLETYENPDSKVKGKGSREIYQKVYHDPLFDKPMLCRVVIEDKAGIPYIVTVYKTSQMKKYLSRN
ncbi:MAG: DUF4258 domain-containing protein [Ignavibacteriae bacterium]|nr:DUF4258 domain-containing protein [Ignavibacteriota bacterium]